MNNTIKPLSNGRRFYSIVENDDGTVDVYLAPVVYTYNTDLGIKEYDITVTIVRGVEPWDGMEDDIRRRFDAWVESGETINL